jgi:hypothetical protein
LTKHASRSHEWILREPLLTNQQGSHSVVFDVIGEQLEVFFFYLLLWCIRGTRRRQTDEEESWCEVVHLGVK